jgi:glutaminyl-tRNA synthetase
LKDTWAKRETTTDEPSTRSNGQKSGASKPQRAKKGTPSPRPAPRLDDPEFAARFSRYKDELGVSDEHAELLADSAEWSDFFEAALQEFDDPPGLAAWIVTDLRGLLGDLELSDLSFGGSEVGTLAALVDRGKVTRRAAKDVLARMVEQGGDPAELVKSMGLEVVDDPDELGGIVDSVLAAWPDKVTEYREGKKGLIGLFVGEVMKKTGGAADPETAKSLIATRLES